MAATVTPEPSGVGLPSVSTGYTLSAFEQHRLDANGISEGRISAQLRVIGAFDVWLGARDLMSAEGEVLTPFLAARVAAGIGSNMIREKRAMLLSFFSGRTAVA